MNSRKKITCVALIMLVVCLTTSTVVLGDGSYAGNWFLWDQWDSVHNTVNDWTPVGSPGYQTYFNLTSNTSNPNNGATYVQGGLDVSLYIEAKTTISVPAGTWAGYQFTVPAQYPLQEVNWAWLPGRFNFLTGSMEIQVTDGAGNLMWSSSPAGGWIAETAVLNASSQTIRVIVKATQTHTLFGPGNFVYFSPFHLKTVARGTMAPVCGDPSHPYPIGDFNQDCLVNFDDFMVIASHWQENSLTPPPPQPPLSQFGYYFVSVDPFANFIQNVCGKTNFNHMDWSVQRAIDTAACGAKMVVNLRWHLFDGNNVLRTDYLTSWALLASQITPYIDTVGAFYVMDEPYWAGVSQSDLETAIALIKSTFPNTPTMVVEAFPMITSGLQIPAGIDYYGFDQYGDFTAIPPMLAIVKSKLLPGQQIVLVPQNILFNGTDAQVASWAYDYYNLALSEELVVGLEVFLWPDISSTNPNLVLAGPLTLAAFDDIGQQILSGSKPKIFFPTSYTVGQGAYSSGTVASVKDYDNNYLVINSTASGITGFVTTDFNVTSISIPAPSRIKVRVNTKSSGIGNTTQTIQFWNYLTSTWDTKDTTAVGTTSVVVRDITVTTGASNYISGGNMKVRIAGSKTSFFTSFGFSHEQIVVLTYN